MRNLTEENLTEVVLDKINAEDLRAKEIISSLIKHLHAFIREVEPTEEEWFKGIDFLTRTGHMCDDKRQEFILLSDTLGVTMLVDAINHRVSEGATETTVTGPFHVEGAPVLENGANIARGLEQERGEFTVVRGRVTNPKGAPIEGALLDVWQSDDDGHYDVQDKSQPEMNLRGIFKTNEKGEYWFRTVKPSSYPIPVDGTAGELLTAMGRHPMRPAHIHFMITAPGHKCLVTHIFVEGDEYLESDAVFGVKHSLVVNFARNESEELAAKYDFPGPFYEVDFDFTLDPV